MGTRLAHVDLVACKPRILAYGVSKTLRVAHQRCTKLKRPASSTCSATSTRWPPCFGKVLTGGLLGVVLSATVFCSGAQSRLESVNRPDLLPAQQTPVIDVAGFLTNREETLLAKEIKALEDETGIKLRLLAQSYPETPGLAVKDFWDVNDDTILFVADPTFGSILNFNVGANVDLKVPRAFWSKLTGKFGNKFYWRDKGENVSIINAVDAIDTCLREPPSRLQCSKIQDFDTTS